MAKKGLPPLWKQIWNYTKAEYRKRLAQANGEEVFVSEEEFDDRLSICRGTKQGVKIKVCHQYLEDDDYDPVEERCKLCGCFLTEKAALATEICPLYQWDGDLHKRMELIGGGVG